MVRKGGKTPAQTTPEKRKTSKKPSGTPSPSKKQRPEQACKPKGTLELDFDQHEDSNGRSWPRLMAKSSRNVDLINTLDKVCVRIKKLPDGSRQVEAPTPGQCAFMTKSSPPETIGGRQYYPTVIDGKVTTCTEAQVENFSL